jgi:hypothetical protein
MLLMRPAEAPVAALSWGRSRRQRVRAAGQVAGPRLGNERARLSGDTILDMLVVELLYVLAFIARPKPVPTNLLALGAAGAGVWLSGRPGT